MITIIAAISKNNALGKNNDLIWHLPEDLKRFKALTSGHHIIMGRNTFESIGKPLPNRTTIIITRNKEYQQKGCLIAHNLDQALGMTGEDDDVFIIGGAQIYKQAIENDVADFLDITRVHAEFDADVFFPIIDENIWEQTESEDFVADEKHNYDYSFLRYQKIN